MIDQKLFLTQNFFLTTIFDTKFLGPHFFGTKIILVLTLFSTQNFFGTRIIWNPTLFLTRNLFGPKMHLKLEFDSGVGPTCFLKSCSKLLEQAGAELCQAKGKLRLVML